MRSDRGEYRYVDVGLKDDPEFQDLCPTTKLAYVFICLNLGRSGIGVIYPGAIEAQSGLTLGQLEAAYAALAGDGERSFDVRREGHVVWIVNQLAGDRTLSVDNRNHRKGIRLQIETLPQRSRLTQAFRERYAEWLSAEPGPPDGSGKGSEGHAEAFRGPRETRDAEEMRSGRDAKRSGAELARARDETARTAPHLAVARGTTPTSEPPPAEPILPDPAEELLSQFYTRGSPRYQDVRAQLVACVTLPDGVQIDRKHGWVRGSREDLASACREILKRPPHARALAVRFVLLRLKSRTQVQLYPALAAPDPAEEQAREIYGEQRAGWLQLWREAHPDELAALEQEAAGVFADAPPDASWLSRARRGWLDGQITERAKFPCFERWYQEQEQQAGSGAPDEIAGSARVEPARRAAARELATAE